MKKSIAGIGLMSGTSLDGLDIAHCNFDFSGEKIGFVITEATTLNYPDQWRKRLAEAMKISGNELMQLHHDFGVYCGNAVLSFVKEKKMNVDYIASHGHTIFHQPQHGFTTQIGCGATIAAVTGINTICDFRSLDVALGGQGAPLVPVGDRLLFSEFESCLNIGGIANISLEKNKKRIAFDICAANIVMNYLAELTGASMDRNGEIAQSGKLNEILLSELQSNPYYQSREKKSIGREWIDEKVLSIINASSASVPDKLRTFTEHIATQIKNILEFYSIKKMLVSGGGAYNTFLMNRIRNSVHTEIIVPDKKTIEFKEALIFALLGALRLKEINNTFSSVTGGKIDSCGGAVYIGAINQA